MFFAVAVLPASGSSKEEEATETQLFFFYRSPNVNQTLWLKEEDKGLSTHGCLLLFDRF
jgi:hypothetical protein